MYVSPQLLYYDLWRFSAVEGACDISKSEFNIEKSG